MLSIDPLHITWTPADVQAVQGGVGLEQESLGVLEFIFHSCIPHKVVQC